MAQPVKIISGYHACTPAIPEDACKAELTSRAAFAMESYRPDYDGMFFDSVLFKTMIGAVSSAVNHESIQIWEEVTGGFIRRLFRSTQYRLSGSTDFLADQLGTEEAEPPSKMIWINSGRPAVIGVAEHWNAVGGPAPYHDTFTFSLYSGEVDHTRIIDALKFTAVLSGALCEFIRANSHR